VNETRAWRLSVEPAADFGTPHGVLDVELSDDPDRVIIREAARSVYLPVAWVDDAADGWFGWAAVTWPNPWHRILRIHGTDRTVIYDEVGTVGPRVPAFLFTQPD
jgi:hypothetical protein